MSEIRGLMEYALSVACIVSFIVLLMGKLGIRDAVVGKAPKLISELFGCDFCLSFWISAILAVSIALTSQRPEALLIPLISTPIARFLL